MKRLFFGVTIFGAVAFLSACPIYPDTGNYRVCTDRSCYDCPDTNYSDACIPWPCNDSNDCGGLACGSDGTCVTNPSGFAADAAAPWGGSCVSQTECAAGWVCGRDNTCHLGDCGGSTGCAGGLICKLVSGVAQCVDGADAAGASSPSTLVDASLDAEADATTSASATTGADATSDAKTALPDALSNDATDAASGPEADGNVDAATAFCNSDSECTGAGSLCIDGRCAAESQLCADGTQCAVTSGVACVDGRCTPECTAETPCATGFACDFVRGVCRINPSPCTVTANCQGGTVCVESHCAAPCTPSDAGLACPGGQVCVNGGCIPDEHAVFACLNDGYPGALANLCGEGQICLHGDCYPSCVADGGSCPSGTACKDVTINKGTFAVCGTAQNLGSECDPEVGATCAAGACIDGYCR